MEACLLYSTTVKLVTDMQDFSQKNAQIAMVYLQNDLPMEGIQQNADTPRKTSPAHTVSCARREAVSVDGVARFKFEVGDVACDDSVLHSQNCSYQSDGHPPGELFKSQIIDVQSSQFVKPCTQNSTSSIPLVPNIIIEHVPSSAALGSHWQASIVSNALHNSLAIGPSLGQKKGRTHSDSSIYEADKRTPCLRSSLSSLQSLFDEPSDVLVHSTTANKDSSNYGANPAACGEVSSGTHKDDSDTFIEPESPTCRKRCRKPALPFLLNLSGLDHFTATQEKSPKTYWLRRHSDSNVAGGQEKGLHAESYTMRSHSASDTIPEIQRDEGMEPRLIVGEVTAEKRFFSEDSQEQSGPTDRRKCQKVKKYLQTRYQNQSLDMDDVFMETDISRPDQLLTEDSPDALLKPENVDRGVIVSDKDIQELEISAPVYLPNYVSLNSEDSESCRTNEIRTTTGPPPDKVRPKKLLHADNNSTNVFENSSLSFSLLSPRQSVFEFPFPNPYSVLGDLPVSSGNIFFSLFPQGCLPSPFLPSPLTLESFTIESPSSAGVLPSPLLVPQDCAVSSPSVAKCWQSTVWGAAASPKKLLKEEDNELKARGGAGPDHEMNRQAFLETQESLCSTTSASLECSSNINEVNVKTSKSNDKPQSLVVSHEYLPDNRATSSPSTIISPKPLLHTLSSPLPSSPVVGTPTRTSPQVVFNYQFSERIHEQRQTGDNFVCPVCGSLFLSYNSLANHVVSHLPSEVITQEGSDSSKVHLCKVCNRSFSRSDMLSRHMRLHTGLRPYECHLCRQVFSRSDHLHTHLRTHTGEKPYRCSHCMYAAPRRDMVTRHMRIHMRGSTRRGRRSSSTSSLASDSYQTSHIAATNEQSAGGHTQKIKASPERRKAGSFHKQRNWSVTSSENNEGLDGFDDKDLLKMTRTESTTSVDSGVSYLTPMSLAPSIWSPGIDSPDVFSRNPGGHFLWPSPELKHELEKGSLAYATNDMDFEMHASFQKCKVTSPAVQTSSQPTDELVEGQWGSKGSKEPL